MKTVGIWVLSILLLIAPGISMVVFSECRSPEARGFGWTKYPGNPVMSPGSSSEWDCPTIYSDCIIREGNELWLYYSGVNSAWTSYSQGLATSRDGRSWTRYAQNPLLTVGAAGAWDDYYVGGASVMNDSGTFRMWYHGHDGTHWRIGYATSADGLVWTKNAGNPVLDLGPPGSWDDNHLVFPCVIKDPAGYKMYYGGEDGARTNIGLAASQDGVSWTRSAQNPVLARGGMGESMDVNGPCVLMRDGKYLMWYNGYNGVVWSIDFASSNDGVMWTKSDANPVLEPGSGFESDDVYLPCVWYNGTTYRMIYTGVGSALAHAFGLATGNSLPLPPTDLVPSDGSWTNNTRPTLAWTFRDLDQGDRQTAFELEISRDPGFGTVLIATGKAASVNSGYVPAIDLPEALNYWRVRCWDDFGDNGNWSATGVFGVDTSLPKNPVNLTSTSHQIGAWSSRRIVDVSWTVPPDGDRAGYAGFSVSWDRSPDTVPDEEVEVSSGIDATSSPALSDGGDHYFHIRAQDGAGNWAEEAAHLGPFCIDASVPMNPTVRSTSHKPKVWSNDNTVDISITGQPAGPAGLEGYAISWDTSQNTIPGPVVNLTADARTNTSRPLADGPSWYFHLRTSNGAGTWSVDPVHLGPFYIDTTPPNVSSLSINSGAELTADPLVSLEISALDPVPGSGVRDMRFSLDGVDWTPWEPVAVNRSLSLGTPDGERYVFFQARDSAGNICPASNDSIFLDTTPPSVTRVAINGGANWTSSGSVVVEVSAWDLSPGSGLAELSFSLDGTSWGQWEPFEDSRNITLLPGEGKRSVYVRCRDRAGNAGGAKTDEISVDSVPPRPLSMLINGGANATSDRTVGLELSAADPEPSSSVSEMSFSSDGIDWSGWEAFASTRSYTLASDGDATIFFRVRDRAQNVAAPVCASILVDTSLPKILMVKVVHAGERNATLEVTTDEPCRILLEYGTGKSYSWAAESGEFLTIHRVSLAKLSPGTTYHFRASATDRGGNPATMSPDQKFTTKESFDGSAAALPMILALAVAVTLLSVLTVAFLRWRRRRRPPGRSI